MRLEPGFVTSLKEEISRFKPELLEEFNMPGALTLEELVALVAQPPATTAFHVENSATSDVSPYYDFGSGASVMPAIHALDNGEIAFCIMVDERATWMLPNKTTLLAMKIAQGVSIGARSITLMMNAGVDSTLTALPKVNDIVAGLSIPNGGYLGAFTSFETLALTPDNRTIKLYNGGGPPLLVPCGTGDLPPAMASWGLLDDLAGRGIKHIIVTSFDDAFSSDPNVLAQHIASERPVTFQVAKPDSYMPKSVLAYVDGTLQLIDSHRLPEDFDPKVATWEGTGTFIATIDALKDAANRRWRWNRLRKQMGVRLIVAHERSISQLSEFYPCGFVEVIRDRHYAPVRIEDDLRHIESVMFKPW